MKNKAVIYVFCSSLEQTDEKINRQIDECTKYANKNDIDVVNIYTDRRFSETVDNRLDFLRMVNDSKKGCFEIILVSRLDRFCRSRYEYAIYKRKLIKNGVRLVSALENNYGEPGSILLESNIEGIHEYYSIELSKEVRQGLRDDIKKVLGNSTDIPLGLELGEDKMLMVNSQTAPIVLEVMTRFDVGENIAVILDSLNERGLLAATKKPFTIKALTYMLKDRKYIGEYKYNNIVIPYSIPPIVPKDLFDRVQVRLSENRNRVPISSGPQDNHADLS